ncbi:acetyltransferase [Pseudoalteromonas piscicida]|uniref:Acyltransferase n=1 Tax=Pseudoalteromonas piscicida TaxID=43662 RepID=A0AAD0RL27_PSEO7|nr:acetyltransferase [Pseudoalteromonas piscicida]ASD68628.1 acyltransferase [Pseudoalteromonas piscicida]AXQ99368.1 acyltransferase [Pseudoalteromonas piscicida]AXR03685.1 acyltransferase [Pseudoalteromonas piscicida]
MLKQILPKWFLGLSASVWLLVNTFVCGLLVLLFGIIKLFAPVKFISTALHFFYGMWCKGNYLGLRIACDKIQVSLPKELHAQGWYLLISNHLSWLDIVVLSAMEVLPAPKFFLKDELKYVPFIGTGAWAMGMPFMKRASKAQIAKNPKLKGMDVERTKASCRNFRDHPTTVINFVEGTRHTKAKHAHQNSPFKHLLKPKAGGVAFALEVLSEQLDGMLNATLAYELEGEHICRAFTLGRLDAIDVKIDYIAMEKVPLGNYQADKAYRVQFQSFMNEVWQRKDCQLEAHWLHSTEPSDTLNEELKQL